MARLQESLKPVVHQYKISCLSLCDLLFKNEEGYYVYCRNTKHRGAVSHWRCDGGGGHASKGLFKNSTGSQTIYNSKCSLCFKTPQGTCRTLVSPSWLFKLSTCPMPLPHSCSHSTRLSSYRSRAARDTTPPDVSWMLVRRCLLL